MGNHKKNEKLCNRRTRCSNEHTWWGKRKNGFTLVELLIVVAIIAVLVAVAIPIFTKQLEKSRESTDMANIRSAYAEIMAEAISDGLDHKSEPIALKQRINDWQSKVGEESLHSIAETVGKPRAEGQAWVEFKSENSKVIIHYGEPVPGDQATVDAMNFPEGSDERKILSSLADAERKALEEYKKSGETKAVGYVVTFNSDGTFILTAVKNKQIFHTKNTASLVREGYMVAVKDGKVGSNLKYDPETKTLIGTPYHIYVSQWHNDTEGINFGY